MSKPRPILKNSNGFHNFLWRTESKEVLNSPQYQELLNVYCEMRCYKAEEDNDEIIPDVNDFSFHIFGEITTYLTYTFTKKYSGKYYYQNKHIVFHHVNEEQLSVIVSLMKERIYERWLYHNDCDLWLKKCLED